VFYLPACLPQNSSDPPPSDRHQNSIYKKAQTGGLAKLCRLSRKSSEKPLCFP